MKKLKESIKVALNSPFYKKRLGDLGITADSINSLADLRKIPFTTKQDLRDNYPYGLVGRSLDDAVRIHSTSGTTGNPCVVVYSEHDICSWANMIARNLYMVGCRKSDIFQNSSGYGARVTSSRTLLATVCSLEVWASSMVQSGWVL